MKTSSVFRLAGFGPAFPVSRSRALARWLLPALAFALLGLAVTPLQAVNTIPTAAQNDPLFDKGYLNVRHYGVLPGASAATNTAGINQALEDAYNFGNAQSKLNATTFMKGSLVVYFEPGTYNVNNTLKAWTATGAPPSAPGYEFATPANHLAIVGSTVGARPKIKLVASAGGFNNPGAPKALLEFKNFERTGNATMNSTEKASQGYNQMLRGIDLDVSAANLTGAIALYFNQAQDSSVEDVSIEAGTGAAAAYAGIKGVPARGWGLVNVSINGGQYGIDTTGTGTAGTVFVGITLTNQTESAINFQGFSPLTMVGFSITAPAGQNVAAITTLAPGTKPHNNMLNLVDGRITLNNTAAAAIDNTAGASVYLRDVHVIGSNRMVKKPGGAFTTSGTAGQWQRINEYNWNNQNAGLIDNAAGNAVIPQNTQSSLNGVFGIGPAERPSFTTNAAPAGNIVSKHVWGKLPSVDDGNAYDPVEGGEITINATTGLATATSGTLAGTLNNLLSTKAKVFLPKGIYRITSTVTIPQNKILFGAARYLTRIEVGAWQGGRPTAETPMITTNNSATSTAYLGDLTIGVDTYDDEGVGETSHDWFNAVHWMAGGDSMVHMGQPYRAPTLNGLTEPSQPHSLIKITGNGGGRWYFVGSRKAGKSNHPGFRILEVAGVSTSNRRVEPLWIYGFNPEHPAGPDHYTEFRWSNNVRIYGGKTEYTQVDGLEGKSSVVHFRGCDNIALYGMGAIRNGVQGNRGNIEFFDCNNALAVAINPQTDDHLYAGDLTLLEKTGSTVTSSLVYPNVVSMYRKGDLNEGPMVHVFTSY